MAEKHELKISISPEGEVLLEVEGVKGKRCLALTEDLEKELGLVIDRQKKSEFYQEETKGHINIKK